MGHWQHKGQVNRLAYQSYGISAELDSHFCESWSAIFMPRMPDIVYNFNGGIDMRK